jgi:hypothetical protein
MKNHNFETHEVPWENIVEETAEYNKQNNRSGDRALTTEEYLYRQKMLNDQARVAGQGLQYSQNLDREQQLLHDMLKRKQMVAEMEQNMTAEQRREYIRTSLLPNVESLPQRERELLLSKKPSEVLAEEADRLRTRILAEQEAASSYKVAADEYKQIMESITTPDKFAREKTFQSYKEMGIEAMKVTKDRKLDKPIYVGPEIGMASEMYGGHPDEFIELIKESRKRMAKDLENQGMNSDAAKKAAADHIKGMMDTSHMMMWYKHFKRNKGESDEKHIKRFNEWLVEQSKRMVQEGVVGGVQVVDTITGDHAHLPAGQGAFDITGMVRAMKEAGFKGDIISEGHSEDSSGLGQGRILTETWRAFGSPIGNYVRGQPGGLRTWGGIQSAYFGHTPATHYIVGAYVPSNEWSLWSEVPFE